MNLQVRKKNIGVVAILSIAMLFTGSLQKAVAQNTPLSLAKVLIGLQSTSNGTTLAKRNEFLINEIKAKNVTFKLTPEIESELVSAGATTALIDAIKQVSSNGEQNAETDDSKPDAELEKLWIVPNIEQNGVLGIRVYSKFNVYNLKGVQSDMVYRFQKNGEFLKTKTSEYSTKSGDLSTRRLLKPNYSEAKFEEYAFLPYSEFGLASGTHEITIDADVILRDGTLVKHLILQKETITIPANRSVSINSTENGVFEKLWVDYDVKHNDKLGMTIHTKAVVNGFKGRDVYLQLLFEKTDGTKLTSSNYMYKSRSGQTAAYKLLKPEFDSARFSDIALFIPYEEFNLDVGRHNLKIKADLIRQDYSQIQFLTSHEFWYNRAK
ncbi:MAG: hypothetical protein ACK5NT_00020 [Pyrinomonadaceae bacterium]